MEEAHERLEALRRCSHLQRQRLWPLLTAYNPPYAACERKTERTIPVVVLRRA
jgi:hypothetical protein